MEVDTTLVIYCEVKKSRPWVGLFCEILPDNEDIKVKVQWLKKEKLGKFILDTCSDGSQYCSIIEAQSILFSDCLQNESLSNERSGPYSFSKEMKLQIMEAYCERDRNI